nr:MAG TPA: hypothetical protein [Caudoviricetes sp.]
MFWLDHMCLPCGENSALRKSIQTRFLGAGKVGGLLNDFKGQCVSGS